MNTPLDLVKEHVIDVVVVDFENMEHIATEVADAAASEGQEVSVELISDAVSELVKEGLVDCFRFSRLVGKYRHVDFDRRRLGGLWFRISRKGKRMIARQSL
jgi:hypothetical protein